jgi:DNA-binding IclR family transcriptional regulator
MNLTLPQLGVLAYAAASDRITVRDAANAVSLPGETARDAVEELAEGGLLARNGTAGRYGCAWSITPNGLAVLAVITEQQGGSPS